MRRRERPCWSIAPAPPVRREATPGGCARWPPGCCGTAEVADHQIVALLALQHLADGFAAHGGFDGVLHVGDIQAVARGGIAIDGEFKVRLADDAEQAEVGNAGHLRITLTISSPFASSVFKSSP